MKTIKKYYLNCFEGDSVEMPEGAEVLTFRLCNEQLQIWALVSPCHEMENRRFKLLVVSEDSKIEPSECLKTMYIGSLENKFFLFEYIKFEK